MCRRAFCFCLLWLICGASSLKKSYASFLLRGRLSVTLRLGAPLRFVLRIIRVWAAWGIVLLLIAVFPANIQTYLNMKATADPRLTFALVRLPLQLPLIAWAWAYTRPMPQRPKE